MKLRRHHGQLSDSIKTVIEIDPAHAAIWRVIKDDFKDFAECDTIDNRKEL